MESVPNDGHRSGADGVGAGTLSSSKRAHTVAVAIPGQGPLAGGLHSNPHPVLFPLTAGIQFYNFSSKTQSPPGPRRQQIIFRKSFRNTLQVPKSPPHRTPPKKISFPQVLSNRTLCCICGVGVFRLSRLVASTCVRVRKMGWDRIKLVWGVSGRCLTARAAKCIAPSALAALYENHEGEYEAFDGAPIALIPLNFGILCLRTAHLSHDALAQPAQFHVAE